MTIAIKIENSDTRDTAIVRLRTLTKQDAKCLLPVIQTHGTVVLKGGESHTSYVHSNQSLLVEELQNG